MDTHFGSFASAGPSGDEEVTPVLRAQKLPTRGGTKGEIWLTALLDPINGSQCAKAAEKKLGAAIAFTDEYRKGLFKPAMASGFLAFDKEFRTPVLKENTPGEPTCGCSAVAVLITFFESGFRKLYIANIGNCRAVLVKKPASSTKGEASVGEGGAAAALPAPPEVLAIEGGPGSSASPSPGEGGGTSSTEGGGQEVEGHPGDAGHPPLQGFKGSTKFSKGEVKVISIPTSLGFSLKGLGYDRLELRLMSKARLGARLVSLGYWGTKSLRRRTRVGFWLLLTSLSTP